MWIKVTRNDISRGESHSCSLCPVARAIRRAFPGKTVTVGCALVNVDGYRTIELPPMVRNFIRDFDSKRPVTPISFRIPKPVLRPD
jgi:hypothetical protein